MAVGGLLPTAKRHLCYSQQMSKKPSVSLQLVKAFVSAKYPNASTLVPHKEGMDSQVFTFETGGEKSVLRLNFTGEGFRRDALCQKLFGADIPIPNIVEFGAFNADTFYCVSAFVGNSNTLQDLTSDELPALIPQVQKLYTVIEQQSVAAISGVGPFNSYGDAAHESWQAYLRSVVSRNGWGSLRARLSPQQLDIVERAEALFEEFLPACPEMRSLYHGDFGSNNVLVEDGKIVGVIDWDCAGVGDPLVDIAVSYFWSSHLECMRLQAEFAEKTLAHLPNYRQRIDCYQLRIGLEEIRDGLETNCPPEMLNEDVQRLAAAIETISGSSSR